MKPATERAAHPTGALEPSVRRDAWVLGVAVGVFGTSFGVLATAVALIATTLRAPFVVVVVSAAAATALVRLVA